MNLKDILLLQKCLNMLSSPEKGEVMAAARAVNGLQKSKGINLAAVCQSVIDLRESLTCKEFENMSLRKELKILKKRTLIQRIRNT